MGDRDYFNAEFGGATRHPLFAQHRGTKFLILGLIVIAIIQAIVYSAGFDAYMAFIRIFALSPERVTRGWIWQLLTMAGLHQPPGWHLLWNCVYIWIFGKLVENRLTTRQFFAFCTGAVLLGSIAFVIMGVIAGDATPAIGASAACVGLLVLAASWYPTMEISIWGIIRIQLWVIAAVLVVFDLLNTLYDVGGVAYVAHLGGAAYGGIYYKWGARIEGVFSRIDAVADKVERKKARKDHARTAELRKEIDRILDKVNREGMASLSDAEKKFLKNASKKLG